MGLRLVPGRDAEERGHLLRRPEDLPLETYGIAMNKPTRATRCVDSPGVRMDVSSRIWLSSDGTYWNRLDGPAVEGDDGTKEW